MLLPNLELDAILDVQSEIREMIPSPECRGLNKQFGLGTLLINSLLPERNPFSKAVAAASTSLREPWPTWPPKRGTQELWGPTKNLSPTKPLALELLQLWEVVLERWLRHGGSTCVQVQAPAMCHWNSMSPDSCIISTRICECPLYSKGLKVLVSAGPLPRQRPTQDQVRPGERGTLHNSSPHLEPNAPYLRAKESLVPQFRPGPCPLQTMGDLPFSG